MKKQGINLPVVVDVPTLPIGGAGSGKSAGLSLRADATPAVVVADDEPKTFYTQYFWEYAIRWLNHLQDDKKRKERTLTGYRYSLQVFKNWLDREGVSAPTRQDVKDWCSYMDVEQWKVATKNLYLTTLRNFFKWLSNEHGFNNIVAGIDCYPDKSKEHKHGFLDAAQMEQLLRTVKTVDLCGKRKKLYPREEKQIELRRARDVAMIFTMLVCGLRTVEVSNLLVGDLKPEGGAYILRVLGKGRDSKERVKIGKDAVKRIQKWLSARLAVDKADDDSPLFCSVAFATFGEKLTPHAVSNLCKFYLEKAGLKEKDIVAHSLRSSTATNAFRNGATLEQVQQQLRHVNITTTMIYLHEAKVADNPVSDILCGMIGDNDDD